MDCLELTSKELFYTAMMMGFDQLVGVVYDWPTDKAARDAELGDVKRALRKRKLLRENSKGEVLVDGALRQVVECVASPASCTVDDEGGKRAILYARDGAYAVLESDGGDKGKEKYSARFFGDEAAARGYVRGRRL
jgi:hypothetical protein